MSPQLLRSLKQLEGHQVRVRLEDGRRLDCELVSSARRGATTVWFHEAGGDDVFIPVASIAEVRQIA